MRIARELTVLVVLLSLTLAAVGCGKTVTVDLAADTSLSGTVATNGTTISHGFTPNNFYLGYSYSAIPNLPPPYGPGGYIISRSHSRGLLSFSLPADLAGAEIKKAEIHLTMANVIGTPFANCGAVNVNHVSFTGTTSETDLYSGAVLGSAGSFNSASVGTPVVIDVTTALQNDIDGSRSFSQYRLQHQTELLTGEAGHNAQWVCGTTSTANYVHLNVTYTPAN